jgi:hypothetical protein
LGRTLQTPYLLLFLSLFALFPIAVIISILGPIIKVASADLAFHH